MRILAADIGATHARFGCFEGEELLASLWLSSRAESFPALLENLRRERPDMAPERADICAFALPGPVRGRSARPSHLPYTVNLDELGLKQAVLLNDFEAQTWAVLGPFQQQLQVLEPGPGTEDSQATTRPLAVIGPGSGLGMGFALPGAGPVFASEGGHMALPLQGEDETAFAGLVKRRRNPGPFPLPADAVLCGPGLELMHEHFEGVRLSAPEIAALPGFASSPAARLFSTLLGRVCRNLALTLLPSTLVITGGVAGKNPHLLKNEHFREALGMGRHPLPALRLLLNTHQEAGLWGAAEAARRRADYR